LGNQGGGGGVVAGVDLKDVPLGGDVEKKRFPKGEDVKGERKRNIR